MNELATDLPEEVAEEVDLGTVDELPPEEVSAAPVDEPPDPTQLQAEIAELQERKTKAEEDAKYWRQQKAQERAAYFKEKQGEKPAPPPKPEVKEPQPDDFGDYNQYIEAKTRFEVQKARAEWEQEADDRAQNQEIQAKEQELQARIQKGFEKYADFEDVALAETVPITPIIKDILMESEIPEDVAYYLGKNRAEAIRISRMSAIQAAKAIAGIEMSLTTAPPTPTTRKVTNAPPPISPVGSAGVIEKDPNDMTTKEFIAWRNANGARPF